MRTTHYQLMYPISFIWN